MNRWAPSAFPLYVQVIVGVILGAVPGVQFGSENYAFGLLNNTTLGQLGQVVIRLLKALAAPLVFFAILEALVNTDITFKHGRRLSVCIGTNLNNDGIILYEAVAALFPAQAFGIDLSLPQQSIIVAAAVMVGVGISGIPEAGLIALPLVLSTAGLPEALVITAVPLP